MSYFATQRTSRTMNIPKYIMPWGLIRALEWKIKPTLIWSSINYLLMHNKFLKILNTLDAVSGPIEVDEYHYWQLMKMGLYMEEFDRHKFGINNKEYYTISVVQLKWYGEYKVRFSEHWLLRIVKVGDHLTVFLPEHREIHYSLRILMICPDWVLVQSCDKFRKKFDEIWATPQEYTMEIDCDKYFFKRCHNALAVISPLTISRSFFPKKMDLCFRQVDSCPFWFNEDIADDSSQSEAVYNIANKSAFPAPYIVYGPAGSGKTTTIVEAILQIWKQRSSDCILVCASTNVACDVVVKRLLKFIRNPNDLYRLYSNLKEIDKVDKHIKPISNYNVKDSCDTLNSTRSPVRKIIITNLCNAWRLQKFELSFSHVFIDEASQANQVETLILLSLLKYSDHCQIVISGDNQLLGPDFTYSIVAWKLLGTREEEIFTMHLNIYRHSILEKLMRQEPYQKDAVTGYNPRYITKLIRNYRSSEEILQVSNQLFYNSEVIACGNRKISRLTGISVFLVQGCVLMPLTGDSAWNSKEVNKILSIVENYLGGQINGKIIEEKDIGIITLYTLQASKIREELSKIGIDDIDVGDAESFQGQEKEVIIISTVYSTHLGCRWNARTFNVAATRAMSSLLIVGDPRALEVNVFWWYFLKLHHDKISIIGKPFVLKNGLNFKAPIISLEDKCVRSTVLFGKAANNLKIDNESAVTRFGYKYGSLVVAMMFVAVILVIPYFVFTEFLPYAITVFGKPRPKHFYD